MAPAGECEGVRGVFERKEKKEKKTRSKGWLAKRISDSVRDVRWVVNG